MARSRLQVQCRCEEERGERVQRGRAIEGCVAAGLPGGTMPEQERRACFPTEGPGSLATKAISIPAAEAFFYIHQASASPRGETKHGIQTVSQRGNDAAGIDLTGNRGVSCWCSRISPSRRANMNRVHSCALILALAGATLGARAQSSAGSAEAQNSRGFAPIVSLNGEAVPPASKATVVTASPEAVCPVSLRALQGTGYGLVHVRGAQGAQVDAPGQRLHLIVINGPKGIARSAQVLVSGFSAKGRIKKTAGPDEERPEISRTMTVVFDPEDATGVAADMVLPGFTSVSAIELQSITYQDGSSLNLTKREACRATPDPMMPVSAR